MLNAPSGRYKWFLGTTILEHEDVKKCCELYTNAKIIKVHMNSFPHCITTSEKWKKYVEENKLQDRVFVPEENFGLINQWINVLKSISNWLLNIIIQI